MGNIHIKAKGVIRTKLKLKDAYLKKKKTLPDFFAIIKMFKKGIHHKREQPSERYWI